MVNGMVIKMCSNGLDRHIIGRMLDRGEFVNLFPIRKNDDSARVLSRGSSYTDTALYDTVDFTRSFMLAAFLIIILDIAICRLIRKCTNRSGTERLSVTENNLTVSMGFTLILTGKV